MRLFNFFKNNNFSHKKKIIQYLVDKNLAKANLGEGCNKAEFIGKDIKVINNKKDSRNI